MRKEMTCIVCPNSCEMAVEFEGKDIKSVEGALCKKGEEYVKHEFNNPQRTIATLVKVNNGEIPLVSVRTTKAIPKDKIFEVMDEIKKITIDAPVQINQVIVENILNLGSDIIATKSIDMDPRMNSIDAANKEAAASSI